MGKGNQTRAAILDEAVAQTSVVGLTGLTIGGLAERLNMSKSGLFAHFGSKEGLQQATLERAAEIFIEEVIRPGLTAPRGVPRIVALMDRWLTWSKGSCFRGGCPMQAAVTELDDKPGPLRDWLAQSHANLHALLRRVAEQAVELGHLRADLDTGRFAFECFGIAFGYPVLTRLMNHPQADRWAREALDDLIARSRPSVTPP